MPNIFKRGGGTPDEGVVICCNLSMVTSQGRQAICGCGRHVPQCDVITGGGSVGTNLPRLVRRDADRECECGDVCT